ncbi:MAG: hypothetical protein Q4E91_11300 [Lachnospiraceae bacterium]|nr:hypothetical protein [Lachnospiraceae bacterium]
MNEMARLCLRLENEDGSFREYKKEKVTARWVKEALKLSKEVNELEKKGDSIAVLEARLEFTCALFGDKDLTPEAILNGLASDELFDKLDEVYAAAIGKKEKETTLGKE